MQGAPLTQSPLFLPALDCPLLTSLPSVRHSTAYTCLQKAQCARHLQIQIREASFSPALTLNFTLRHLTPFEAVDAVSDTWRRL